MSPEEHSVSPFGLTAGGQRSDLFAKSFIEQTVSLIHHQMLDLGQTDKSLDPSRLAINSLIVSSASAGRAARDVSTKCTKTTRGSNNSAAASSRKVSRCRSGSTPPTTTEAAAPKTLLTV
eukprot:CAMPEP_0178453346 /NCGR_PEP_ID=MMETSP0689_2-20121128/44761_1 /TAXON_ID=160604 /ORGANISM="Amphidinium massartii, Strain CS-259" /LENGTH=119 /DNA_ID=CAMNT_0020079177 /DNA_START=96 /DNA_END=457 /DNA_ORIENTATION=+